MKLSISLALVLALSGCTESFEVRLGTVAPTRVPCTGLEAMMCLSITTDGDDVARPHYDDIEGFTFAWGVTSRIRYHIEPVRRPVPDQASENWVLDEVIDANPAEQRFGLAFPENTRGNGWFRGPATELDLWGTAVSCADAAVCEAIAAFSTDGTPFTVTMDVIDATHLRAAAVN